MKEESKIIIVTGASSGIGKEVTKKFCCNGWKVVALGRSREKLSKLKKECKGGKVELIQRNLCNKGSEKLIVKNVYKKYKRLDAVFAGAGFGIGGNIGEKQMNRADEMVRINLLSLFYLLEAITPIFKKQMSGHLVGVGSVAGIKAAPGFALYSATKFGMRALIEGWRNEIQQFGIKTTVIMPGVVDTPFWETFSSQGKKMKFKKELMLPPSVISDLAFNAVTTSKDVAYNEIIVRPTKQLR